MQDIIYNIQKELYKKKFLSIIVNVKNKNKYLFQHEKIYDYLNDKIDNKKFYIMYIIVDEKITIKVKVNKKTYLLIFDKI